MESTREQKTVMDLRVIRPIMRPLIGYCLIAIAVGVMVWIALFQLNNPSLTQTQVFLETWKQILIAVFLLISGGFVLDAE